MFTAQREDDDVAQIFIDKLDENIKQVYRLLKFQEEDDIHKK